MLMINGMRIRNGMRNGMRMRIEKWNENKD